MDIYFHDSLFSCNNNASLRERWEVVAHRARLLVRVGRVNSEPLDEQVTRRVNLSLGRSELRCRLLHWLSDP